MKKRITGKSYVKIFPNFKLKIEFNSHKKVVSVKITTQQSFNFFTRKSSVNCFLLNFTKEFLYKLIGDLQQKNLQDFPLILTRVHFTRNSHGNFFYREIPLLFFPTLKFKIEFHSHKKVVSPKLENCAHLFILNYNCAKFQKNQRTFLDR